MSTADDIMSDLAASKVKTAATFAQKQGQLLLIFVPLTLLMLAMYAAMFLYSWIFGDWQFFDIAPFGFLIGGSVFMLAYAGVFINGLVKRKQEPDRRGAQALLTAFSRADDATMPIMSDVKGPLAEDGTARHRIGPLPALKIAPYMLPWWRFIGPLFLIAAMIFEEMFSHFGDIARGLAGTASQYDASFSHAEVWVSVTAIIELCGFVVALLSVSIWLNQRLWTHADGLIWLEGARWKLLRWENIHMVGAYVHPSLSEHAVTYVIDGTEALVMWTMPRYTEQKRRDASASLLNLVMARLACLCET